MYILEKIKKSETGKTLLLAASSMVVSFVIKNIADKIWLKTTDSPPPDKADNQEASLVQAMTWAITIGAVASFLSLLTKRKIQKSTIQ